MNKINLEIAGAFLTLLSWIGIGTILFHRLENWTWIEAFYFSVVTITTVGFGDLTPTSDISRLFVAIYILVGVSIGIVALGRIGSGLYQLEKRIYKKSREMNGRAPDGEGAQSQTPVKPD